METSADVHGDSLGKSGRVSESEEANRGGDLRPRETTKRGQSRERRREIRKAKEASRDSEGGKSRERKRPLERAKEASEKRLIERDRISTSKGWNKHRPIGYDAKPKGVSRDVSVRGSPGPEETRSGPIESTITELGNPSDQLSMHESEDFEPSAGVPVEVSNARQPGDMKSLRLFETDEELITELGDLERLMDCYTTRYPFEFCPSRIKFLHGGSFAKIAQRTSAYMREGHMQQWLYLRGQVQQVFNRPYMASRTVHTNEATPITRDHYELQEIETLIELHILHKNNYQAEYILEELASHIRGQTWNAEFEWVLEKLADLYIKYIERIKSILMMANRSRRGMEYGKGVEQLASTSVLDRVAQIDCNALTHRVVDKHLMRLESADLENVLYFAIARGACNLAQMVLDKGAQFGATAYRFLIHDPKFRLKKPLHLAVGNGYIDMVMLLVARGADIEAQSEEFDDGIINGGLSPLHIAVRTGRLTMVMCLHSLHAKIDSRCMSQKTPLIWAASRGDTKIVRFLLDIGARVDLSDNHGDTALHVAALAQQPDSLRLLLGFGADVMVRGDHGRTALHSATTKPGSKMIECIDILVDNGVDVDAKGVDCATALHIASVKANTTAVEHLIKQGASLFAEGALGMPLHYAVRPFLWDIPWVRDQVLPTINILLQHGANINKRRTSDGRTPLHVAGIELAEVEERSNLKLKILESLCVNGADVSIRDNESKTALDYAGSDEAATDLLMRYLPLAPAFSQGQSLAVDHGHQRSWELT
ncbi:MAG: hypothetical protein Q9169_005067 [Polycauliona sp. 2 TL-2023]